MSSGATAAAIGTEQFARALQGPPQRRKFPPCTDGIGCSALARGELRFLNPIQHGSALYKTSEFCCPTVALGALRGLTKYREASLKSYRGGSKTMQSILVAFVAGALSLPSLSFAHDTRRWDDGRGRYERAARPGDPGYYCHRHERKIHKDDTRRHCHSAYNDPHRPTGGRDFWFPWWRR